MIHTLTGGAVTATLDADVCIVGSGAAGLALAAQFLDTGWRVIVLESGQQRATDAGERLNVAQSIGTRHRGATAGRVRALGGTTLAWGGQLLPLRASEIGARAWIPHSGWPLSLESLQPHYRRAEAMLGVVGPPYDDAVWDRLGLERPAFDRDVFTFRFSQWAPLGRRNLAVLLGRALRRSQRLQVLLDATVARIATAADGSSVREVDAVAADGSSVRVRAEYYVLACGAIETPRLLLSSTDAQGRAIANASGLVGRFFQDHVSCVAGEILPASRERLQRLFDPRYRDGTMYSCKIELSDSMQESLRTLNAIAHVKFAIPQSLGLLEARRMIDRLQRGQAPVTSLREAAALAGGAAQLSRMALARVLARRRLSPSSGAIRLLIDTEQRPDADSRIRLGAECDALGLRRAQIDWRVGAQEMQSIKSIGELLGEAWERAGLGRIRLTEALDFDREDEIGAARDTYHQMGTTRMSTLPGEGVVNADLRCHDVANLYIVGGSVFPTGGVANPTFSIIALALRLADEIKRRLGQRNRHAA